MIYLFWKNKKNMNINDISSITKSHIKKENINIDLFGIDDQYNVLESFVNNVFNNKADYTDLYKKLDFYNNILLTGLPGTGKTRSIYKLLSNQKNNVRLYQLKLGTLLHADMGKTSQIIEDLFNSIRDQASPQKKLIILLDEIDSIGLSRFNSSVLDGIRRALISLMIELDKNIMRKNIVFIGISNIPELLDPGLVRRFTLKIKYPDVISKGELKKFLNYLVKETWDIEKINKIIHDRGFTPSDLKNLFQNILVEHNFSEEEINWNQSLLLKLNDSESTKELMQLSKEKYNI